jgi:hypothetical protein
MLLSDPAIKARFDLEIVALIGLTNSGFIAADPTMPQPPGAALGVSLPMPPAPLQSGVKRRPIETNRATEVRCISSTPFRARNAIAKTVRGYVKINAGFDSG